MDRPKSWQGMAVEWSSSVVPPLVFLQRFALPGHNGAIPLFLYGLRYELSEAVVGGESLGEGYFLEYVIVRSSEASGWTADRLLQHSSVTYSNRDDKKDYVPAAKVRVGRELSPPSRPRWEMPKDAVWPLAGGEPMHFVGQVTFPENDVSRSHFTWDLTAYLFVGRDDRGECFKIVEQDVGTQSAADHYRSEES